MRTVVYSIELNEVSSHTVLRVVDVNLLFGTTKALWRRCVHFYRLPPLQGASSGYGAPAQQGAYGAAPAPAGQSGYGAPQVRSTCTTIRKVYAHRHLSVRLLLKILCKGVDARTASYRKHCTVAVQPICACPLRRPPPPLAIPICSRV